MFQKDWAFTKNKKRVYSLNLALKRLFSLIHVKLNMNPISCTLLHEQCS